jgi:hypothetical protein
LVLEEFIKKMSHAVYSGFPQEGEEDAIERWMRVVELTFQVIQESVKKMTKDQQLNRELIDSLLNLGEKSLSSWIEDNQKHYSQLEIADINKILNSVFLTILVNHHE